MVPGENWSYARVVINQKKEKKNQQHIQLKQQDSCAAPYFYYMQLLTFKNHYVIYSLLLDRASLVLMI